MENACAVCQLAFTKKSLKTSVKLSSGERVCGAAECMAEVKPCIYCQWTGISHQPVSECLGPGCREVICQLCEESFENRTWDRFERICEHAIYND